MLWQKSVTISLIYQTLLPQATCKMSNLASIEKMMLYLPQVSLNRETEKLSPTRRRLHGCYFIHKILLKQSSANTKKR